MSRFIWTIAYSMTTHLGIEINSSLLLSIEHVLFWKEFI